MYAGTMALVPDGFKSGVYSADGEAALQFTFIYVTKNVTHPVLKINGQAARPLPGTARGGHAFDAPHRVREKLGAGTLFARNATTVEFVAKEDGAATAFSFSFDERRGHVAASVAALNDDLLEWLDHAMRHLDADPDLAAFDALLAASSNLDATKHFFPREKAEVVIFEGLRRVVANDDEDVRRDMVDRVCRVFAHVHISTAPRMHFAELAHFAASEVQTEGADRLNASFGDFLHVNNEQVMEAWEFKWCVTFTPIFFAAIAACSTKCCCCVRSLRCACAFFFSGCANWPRTA